MARQVRTMFVQSTTKVRTILYELFGHCTNIVRTLYHETPKLASLLRSLLYINQTRLVKFVNFLTIIYTDLGFSQKFENMKKMHWVFFVLYVFWKFLKQLMCLDVPFNLCVCVWSVCHSQKLVYIFHSYLCVQYMITWRYFKITSVQWLLSYLKIIQFNSSWLVCNSQLLLCINSILWDEVPLFLIPTKISKVLTWLTWDMLQHKHMSQATSSIHYHHNFSNVKT